MRAALYARVSSQAQKDRETITSQVRALRSYVERQGWTLVGEYIDGSGINIRTLLRALARLIASGRLKRAGTGSTQFIAPIGWKLGLPEDDLERDGEMIRAGLRRAERARYSEVA